jgi:hypothetical protein
MQLESINQNVGPSGNNRYDEGRQHTKKTSDVFSSHVVTNDSKSNDYGLGATSGLNNGS